ncbi:Gfo/Idh/MocA family protein [Paenibacillus cremeus]|uniref:Gfo/Idh/MocA family oxidoreductase n=1 Tax=Paenibacillus cremeus TaxID=2163881 RepID=A0A559K7A1_9BACL|nr:Gfo/Idh/MocA family oxidoreductase [Paenibacillus cremeus]TVY07994.1 Gfo/Idh/MocA family oxidoreductase [Paenibacillus cremeus]
MKDAIHFAIIGFGEVSQYHAKAIAELPGAKLAAVCDRNLDKRKKAEELYGAATYSDYHEMLQRDDIDVVNILTASGTHAEIGIAAAKAGKHVITEKPIDICLDKADALIDACREAGVKLSCIFQHRFNPAVMEIKKAIREEKFGQLNFGAAHTKWYRPQEYYDQVAWRGTWALDGGGAVMNQSIHYIDLLQYIMGDVEEVFAYCATRAHERIEVEDLAVASVKFKSGALGMIEGNVSAYPGFYTRLDVYGEHGSAVIESNKMKEWKLKSGEGYDSGQEQSPVNAHYYQLKDMMDAIKEDRQPFVSGAEARKSLEIVQAIYRSARTGAPVKITG